MCMIPATDDITWRRSIFLAENITITSFGFYMTLNMIQENIEWQNMNVDLYTPYRKCIYKLTLPIYV